VPPSKGGRRAALSARPAVAVAGNRRRIDDNRGQPVLVAPTSATS